ncbi:hypothetical protein E2320_013668, partial [Naja naja]
MAHSQLPCPLFLLCSLLMLPSVLLQEVPMPGGLYPVPVTTEEVKEAAAFAVERYNERSKNPNYFKQLNIVVSGMKYYLTVKVGKTVCEKSSGPLPFNGIQQCELFPQDQQEVVTNEIKHGSELMHYDYFCCDYLIIVVPIFKIQVVSGIKYYLTVELGKTVCKKSSGPLPFSGIQKCELLPQDQQ